MSDSDEYSDYEDNDNSHELTYDDIIDNVDNYNKTNNSISLEIIKENIDDVLISLELDEDNLNQIIDHTWNKLEFIIDNEVQHLLRTDKEKIKNGFRVWMQNSTMLGKQINYIDKLNNFINRDITLQLLENQIEENI